MQHCGHCNCLTSWWGIDALPAVDFQQNETIAIVGIFIRMNPEGKIHIKLVWEGQRIQRVDLRPRPLPWVNGLLRGKDASYAIKLIPMLYGLCRGAQGAAASAALAAAQDKLSDPSPEQRERRVLIEALQEHLWRFLLDLPVILDAKADPGALAHLRKQLATVSVESASDWKMSIAGLEQSVSSALLGSNATVWHDMADIKNLLRILTDANTATANLLLACWRGGGRWGSGGVALMPPIDRSNIFAELVPNLQSEADFAQYPRWRGQVMETGALARMKDHPLLSELLVSEGATVMARLLARLVEVGELFVRLRTPPDEDSGWVQSASLGPRAGLSWVQTARGLLLHRVELDEQGKVEDYCIVAPTEWNFHPDGACVRGLAGKFAESALQARHSARLMAHALDPCVSCEIEVEHA